MVVLLYTCVNKDTWVIKGDPHSSCTRSLCARLRHTCARARAYAYVRY